MRETYAPTSFIATDRRQAMALGEELPSVMVGAVLFADIAGFTALVEQVEQSLGPKQAADVMTQQINRIFAALISEVQRYDGVVVSFGGDAITCWFDKDNGLRAAACGLAMQRVMTAFKEVRILPTQPILFTLKVAIATGSVKRFVVGDSKIQRLDVLAGKAITTLAEVQRAAVTEYVVLDGDTACELADNLFINQWIEQTGKRFALVTALKPEIDTRSDQIQHFSVNEPFEKTWLLEPIYERLKSGQGQFAAEIRSVVVLFLNFSGLDFANDSQAETRLDAYICAVQRTLGEHGGFLIKLTIDDKGSYVLATFGAPLGHDNDTQRALHTALTLRRLSKEFSFIQEIRIGINQGRMLAGIFGSTGCATYDLLGNDVNLTSRLMIKAQSGQILLTKSIVEAARDHYAFGEPVEFVLKGASKPVSVFELLIHSLPQPPLFPRHLVGRETERQQMKHLWAQVQLQSGQILQLEGGAGIGKSHLVADFLEDVKQVGGKTVYANCESTSQGTPYYLWRQILRHFSPSTEQNSPLPRFNDELTEAAVFGQPMMAGEDPAKRQAAIFAGFNEWLSKSANAHPLVLVFDDAQWMDEMSLKLMLALGRQLADWRIFLILCQRPLEEDNKLLLTELIDAPHFHSIVLTELSPDDVERLLATRLSAKLSPLMLSFFLVIAQGNPFFTDELLNSLQELGRLQYVPEKQQWTLSTELFQMLQAANCLTRDPATGDWQIRTNAPLTTLDLGLPNTIEQLTLSRIDLLPEAHRLTLKVASVIGRTFTHEVLIHAHPGLADVATLQQQLQLLASHNLIVQDRASVVVTHSFRHQLTQEATYKALPQADRRQLHLAVGLALEVLTPSAVEELAFHFTCSEQIEQSIPYLELAARNAQNAFANQTALHYYNQALAFEERKAWLKQKVHLLHVLGQRDEEWRTLEKVANDKNDLEADIDYLWAEYYESIGNYELASVFAERARQFWLQQKDHINEARCLVNLGLIARRRGDYQTAHQWQEMGRQSLTALGIDADTAYFQPLLIKVYNELGAIHRQWGQYQQASEFCEKARTLSQTTGNRSGEVEALTMLGWVEFYRRNLVASRRYHAEALTIRRVIGDLTGEGTTLYSLGATDFEDGNYNEAEAYFLEALKIQRLTQNRWEEANLLNMLGVLAYQFGDLATAETRLRAGVQLSRQLADKAGEAGWLCNLGQVLRDRGKLYAAERLLQQGLSMAKKLSDKYLVAMCQSHLALVYLQLGQFKKTLQLAQQSMRNRIKIGAIELTTIDQTTLAAAFWSIGQRKRALVQVNNAYDRLVACNGSGPEFPQRDYLICAQIWQAAKQHVEAMAALQAAYHLLIERAGKISDRQKQISFLQNVSWHAQIIQAYEAGAIPVDFARAQRVPHKANYRFPSYHRLGTRRFNVGRWRRARRR